MASLQWAPLGLSLVVLLAFLASTSHPAVAQNYDYDQGQETPTFQENQDEQASEFPGAEAQETEPEGGGMGGAAQNFNQDPYPNGEAYPNTEQDFSQQTSMANEPGQTDMAPGETQGEFDQNNPQGNVPNENAPGKTTPSETVPDEANPSETPQEEAASQDPTDTSEAEPSDASSAEASAAETTAAAAAFGPAAGSGPHNYTYEYQNSWQKIKGGEVGPETIIGAAIGAVLGMSLCICCICVCYIRQRNIARAQYGTPGGGAIEL